MSHGLNWFNKAQHDERKKARREGITKEGRKENTEAMHHQFHNRKGKEIYPQNLQCGTTSMDHIKRNIK